MVDAEVFWGGMFVSLWVAMFFVFSIRGVARSYPKPPSELAPARAKVRARVSKA